MTMTTIEAPTYRYITTDLLTDKVLAEIPFQGVSYGRAANSSGSFSGKIPVNDQTLKLNLYTSTLAAKTALYVLRNDVCVWGGIIWNTKYDESHVLSVSATEFPSYLNRREIWRDFTLAHEVSVVNSVDGSALVTITDGTVTDGFVKDATIHLDFAEDADKKFNGFYTITAPSSGNTFTTIDSRSQLTVVDFVHNNGTFDLHTETPHNWSVGDSMGLMVPGTWGASAATYTGQWRIIAVDPLDKTRIVAEAPPGNSTPPAWTTGEIRVSRPLPVREFSNVNMTTHTDTFHYARHLIDSMISDFSNVTEDTYELSTKYGVTSFSNIQSVVWGNSYCTFVTPTDHNLSIGQLVSIQNVSALVDGDYSVTNIESRTQFTVSHEKFSDTGNSTPTTKSLRVSQITSVQGKRTRVGQSWRHINGEVTAVTSAPHGLRVGEWVELSSLASVQTDPEDSFNGRFRVSRVHSDLKFSYVVPVLENSRPTTNLTPPTVTVAGTTYPVISVQNDGENTTVKYSGLTTIPVGALTSFSAFTLSREIQDITYDASIGRVWVETTEPHSFNSGDTVTIAGAQSFHKVLAVRADTASRATVSFVEPCNFVPGDTVTFSDVYDLNRITNRTSSSGRVQLGIDRLPWYTMSAGTVQISGLTDVLSVASMSFSPGKVRINTTGAAHSIAPGTEVSVDTEYKRVISSFEIVRDEVILRTATPHNFVANTVGEFVSPTLPGFQGKISIHRVGDTEIWGTMTGDQEEDIKKISSLQLHTLSGSSFTANTNPVGDSPVVSSVGANYLEFDTTRGRNLETYTAPANSTVSGLSLLNGPQTLYSVGTDNIVLTATHPFGGAGGTHTYKVSQDFKEADFFDEKIKDIGRVRALSSVNREAMVLNKVDGTTNSVQVSLPSGTLGISGTTNRRTLDSGTGATPSRFNGTRAVTVYSPTEFYWASTTYPYSITERPPGGSSWASVPISTFVGASVSSASPTDKTITYAKPRTSVLSETYPFGLIVGRVQPTAAFGTYGPYLNGSVQIDTSLVGLSGVSKLPPRILGLNRKKVGSVLKSHAEGVTGYNYRVDTRYVEESGTFARDLVLTLNDFPNPPVPGELSPLSRFGADNLVFEHPGNISDYSIDQRGSDAVTRLFMVGRNPWGEDVPPPTSAGSATSLLRDGWPVLDDSAKNASTYDFNVLYDYAMEGIGESRPPQGDISITVNGSLEPHVGTYAPGEWCSIIIKNDEYVNEWLRSDVEPRDTVVLRKIDSYKVSVPDGTAFPEKVALELIPSWEIDRHV